MSTYKVVENAQRIEEIIKEKTFKYESVLSHNFYKCQQKLIDFLLSEVTQLKREIGVNKMKSSQQNLDALIVKKRTEMEIKRKKEQVSWRELNDRYKKLMEEQKILLSQNRQSEFDLKNLLQKIEEISKRNGQLVQNIKLLEETSNNHNFLTEIKEIYQSPYKHPRKTMTKQKLKEIVAKQYVLNQKDQFITTKYRLSHFGKCNQSIQNVKSFIFSYSPDSKLLSPLSNQLAKLTLQRKQKKYHSNKCKPDKNRQQLLKYISHESIREKILTILQK